MQREITNKDVNDILLEVQSHSGLPIKSLNEFKELLFVIKELCTIEESLIFSLKNEMINKIMIMIHDNRKKNINNNIKAYDW